MLHIFILNKLNQEAYSGKGEAHENPKTQGVTEGALIKNSLRIRYRIRDRKSWQLADRIAFSLQRGIINIDS